MLIMLHHVMHLLAINPYSKGPLARFSSYLPYQTLLIPHQHQLARELDPYIHRHHVISATPTVNPTGV